MRIVIADNDPDALDPAVIDLDLEGHVVDKPVRGETAEFLILDSVEADGNGMAPASTAAR